MNTTIDLMKNHRSIRRFTKEPITPEQLASIIDAAKSASVSSFLQCTSIIRITESNQRTKIMALAKDQAYIKGAAEFLIFCADFNRHKTIMPEANLGYTEQLLVASIDAAMMGQNALLAAESMQLGGVFIGAIRNHPE